MKTCAMIWYDWFPVSQWINLISAISDVSFPHSDIHPSLALEKWIWNALIHYLAQQPRSLFNTSEYTNVPSTELRTVGRIFTRDMGK